MDSESETRPLLYSFETPSWRKRLKRKCQRVPFEVAVTGIILGLFFIVVTLLIFLENYDSSSAELTIDKPAKDSLLGSPFKYNKKAVDKSWQDKKSSMKLQNKDKYKGKWDTVDKGWKQLFDPDRWENMDSMVPIYESPNPNKNILLSSSSSDDSNWMKIVTQLKILFNKGLHSVGLKSPTNGVPENEENSFLSVPVFDKIKWKDVDNGWNKLLNSGWDDDEIKEALYEAWKSRLHLAKNGPVFDGTKWSKMDEGYKKLIDIGWTDEDVKEGIYDAWKEGEQIMELGPIPDDEKWKNIDNEWKKLYNKGSPNWGTKGHVYRIWKDAEARRKLEKFNNMKWKKVQNGWKSICNQSINIPLGCPFARMQSGSLLGASVPSTEVDCAVIAEDVRKTLGRCVDLSFLPKRCKPFWRTKCYTTYQYRKTDGTCNNKIHPTWGRSGTPFVRMIAPDYGDGSSSLRLAENGQPLPNARSLSRKLYSKKLKPDSNVTMLFLYFGLIVDHDMVQTAIDTSSIPCCDEKFEKHPENRPRECLQIDIPDDDPFYGPRNVKCLNLVRSVPAHGECIGRREQLNKATSFLDGSAVYGSAIQDGKRLRSFSKGQLRTQIINNTPYMMFSEATGFSCGTPAEPLPCFEAGDPRVNMLVELTATHALCYREHNRIATELHKLNPSWTDEKLFQEARKILTGELQHITYNEFLPLLLGEKALGDYDLKINKNEIYEGYDDTIDPTVFNVFATAAFRFGHSLAQGTLDLIGPNNTQEGKVALHETFFNPHLLYHNGLDSLIRGAASQRTHSIDSYITPEVREHLFQPAGADYGHDLAAVSIQRGRDHGLPSYVKWRSVCGLSEINNWEDLHSVMDEERASMLQEVYQSVEDIDLIPGALAEKPVGESLLGPTYLCIIGRQFKKTRKGDRFWYEQQNNIGSFTKDQLTQIYNANMARIVCDNSDDIRSFQKFPFTVSSENNRIVSCDEIPKVDLSKWAAV